jgi:hypothetical protein
LDFDRTDRRTVWPACPLESAYAGGMPVDELVDTSVTRTFLEALM